MIIDETNIENIEPGDLIYLSCEFFDWLPENPRVEKSRMILVINCSKEQTPIQTGNLFWKLDIIVENRVFVGYTKNLSASTALAHKAIA